jgi:imidazolonepropionase-like amidohydrolase
MTLKNGRWWDGRGFRAETVHTVGGLLTRRSPRVPTQTIDLAGGYVVPPLGDAHCHHFDNPATIGNLIARYLHDGIFYAQNTGNSAVNRRDPRVALRLNRPDSVDVTWADASLTGTLGHPFFVYEALANGIYRAGAPSPEALTALRTSRKAEGDAYIFADDAAMLARIWPQYESRRPDFLKVILSRSERHAEAFARQDPGGHGLDPALLPEVVTRAHRLGMRVWAHVDSAADFHTGTRAGVDGFAHLPGYGMGSESPEPFLLSEADARDAGRRGIFVNPTGAIAKNYAPDAAALKRVQAVQRRNLMLLKRHGVRLTIGMDSYGTDAWPEAQYLAELGVLSPDELLRAWWEWTPQAIFPGRRIGRLADGWEASFLVLKADPRADLQNLHGIVHRVKQGVLLPEMG